MDYLDVGHGDGQNLENGICWYFKDKLLFKENTNHSDWLDSNEYFSDGNFACGRYDKLKKIISFVGYSLNESRKEFIKKHLLQKFDGKIIEF